MNIHLEIHRISESIPQQISAFNGDPQGQRIYSEQRDEIAEWLFAKGCRKLPVQTGDIVYSVFIDPDGMEESIIELYEVRYIAYDGLNWLVAGKDMEFYEIGSDGAFLTKEEAEKYLQENDKSDSQMSGKVKKPYESPRVEIIKKPNIFASACPREVE